MAGDGEYLHAKDQSCSCAGLEIYILAALIGEAQHT